GNLGMHCAVDQHRGQCGFGGEISFFGGPSSVSAEVGVLRPRLGQVEGTVDESVSAGCGVGQKHRDLGVLDAAPGAAERRCTPTLCTPFLTSPVSSTTKIAPGSPN